jgi:hypothetical protein
MYTYIIIIVIIIISHVMIKSTYQMVGKLNSLLPTGFPLGKMVAPMATVHPKWCFDLYKS